MANYQLAILVLCLSACCARRFSFSSTAKNDDEFNRLFDDREFAEDDDNPSSFKATEENLPKVGELFEGDMVMSSRLRDAVLGVDKRSALVDTSTRWPHATVPYTFSKDIHPYMKMLILRGIKTYKKFTCIKLIPRTTETNYVEFTSKPNTCSSSVGMIGGKQIIKLGIGCRVLGTVLHEIMHALGIIHEQSRPDRDKHILVKFSNIKSALVHNFEKYSLDGVTDVGVEYNFNSVMHYRNNAFTKNGEDTLTSILQPSLHFGQRVMFSNGDVQMINRLYCNSKKKSHYSSDALVPDMTDTTIMEKRSHVAREGFDDGDDDEYDR